MPFDEYDQLKTWPKATRASRLLELLEATVRVSGEMAARQALEHVARFGRDWPWLIDKASHVAEGNEGVRSICRSLVDRMSRIDLDVGDQTGMNRNQVERLLQSLEGAVRRGPRPTLHVHFTKGQVYAYGLCAIAAWAVQNVAEIEFHYSEDADERTRAFIHSAGVIEGLRDREGNPTRFDRSVLIGFTRIRSGRTFPTDEHAQRLVTLFRQNLESLRGERAKSLGIAFAELIENVVKHASISSDAWLFANYHPEPKIMHIAICDRGRGIRRSFLESESEAIREIGEHPTDWIRRCTDPLITSKMHGHAGYGLYVVRELCRRNTGSFLLVSGSASYRIAFREQASGGLREDESIGTVPVPWKGTFLGMNLKLDDDHELPLDEIYATLPAPRGYEGEESNVDLFQL